jgi:hypothetical protein
MTIDSPVRIMLVSGSLRAGSTNTALLQTARAVAPAGVVTTIYDGLNLLPHFDPDDDVEGSHCLKRRRSSCPARRCRRHPLHAGAGNARDDRARRTCR